MQAFLSEVKGKTSQATLGSGFNLAQICRSLLPQSKVERITIRSSLRSAAARRACQHAG
jgi:hypothetical protein